MLNVVSNAGFRHKFAPFEEFFSTELLLTRYYFCSPLSGVIVFLTSVSWWWTLYLFRIVSDICSLPRAWLCAGRFHFQSTASKGFIIFISRRRSAKHLIGSTNPNANIDTYTAKIKTSRVLILSHLSSPVLACLPSPLLSLLSFLFSLLSFLFSPVSPLASWVSFCVLREGIGSFLDLTSFRCIHKYE